MHHCVGSYDRECMTGWTQIFSLLSASGRRLSTLQLTAQELVGKLHFAEMQNAGACNERPPKAAVAAARELLSDLNKGLVRCHVGHPTARLARAHLHMLCGFDYWSDAAWERARADALPYLPADLQRLGPMDSVPAVSAFKLKRRSEDPELSEPDDDHEDFEKRVLRWIR